MKFISIALITALASAAGNRTNTSQPATPTVKDVSWTADGGIRVDRWLVIEEGYGRNTSLSNTILKQTKNEAVYCNDMVHITKQWELKDDTLIVRQRIWPVSEAGRRSDLILKILPLRSFEWFYTPYGFSSPKISGKWIKAGETDRLQCGYRGAYSNSMTYTLLCGPKGGVMLDRVISNGYIAWEGGVSEAAGDFSRLTWPMLAFGHWSWNRGHPGPVKAWMENVYPPEGGSVEYRIHFFRDASREQLTSKAYSLYLRTRKQVAVERGIYEGWEKAHKDPPGRVGFCAFVWNSPPGRVTREGDVWIANLREMRRILDENGMADAVIYLWVWLYDGKRAGWGEFPLDCRDIKNFFSKARAVHDVKLGLYVNFWICSVEAPVYKAHPEWFTKEYHKSDGNEDAYAGKLPYWGDYLASQMPALIKAYDLDFVFFDGADWTTRWRGTHEQCRQFFRKVSQVLHEHDAEFLANGNVPFVDIGMKEGVAGMDEGKDRALADNVHNLSFHKQILGPEFTWSEAVRAPIEDSGRAILKYFIDRPEFIVRWPLHYTGAANEHILKDFFTPWVKRRAALTNRQHGR